MNAVSITFDNTATDANAVLTAATGFLECEGAYTPEIELALAEVVNNIVDHAFSGPGKATLDLCTMPDRVHCVLQDDGACYNPDGAQPYGNRGFGWGLIKTIAKRSHLQRIGNTNHLTLEFDRPP